MLPQELQEVWYASVYLLASGEKNEKSIHLSIFFSSNNIPISSGFIFISLLEFIFSPNPVKPEILKATKLSFCVKKRLVRMKMAVEHMQDMSCPQKQTIFSTHHCYLTSLLTSHEEKMIWWKWSWRAICSDDSKSTTLRFCCFVQSKTVRFSEEKSTLFSTVPKPQVFNGHKERLLESQTIFTNLQQRLCYVWRTCNSILFKNRYS